jgi:hypothetical protein
MMNPLNRTRTIGIKVSEAAFETLREVAESQGKPLGEWCRDTLMKAAVPHPARPSEFAVIAEVTATQAILIDLLCLLGRDGRISTQRAQEIVDRAHNAKFKEAIELLRYAYSRAAKLRLDGPALAQCPPRNTDGAG